MIEIKRSVLNGIGGLDIPVPVVEIVCNGVSRFFDIVVVEQSMMMRDGGSDMVLKYKAIEVDANGVVLNKDAPVVSRTINGAAITPKRLGQEIDDLCIEAARQCFHFHDCCAALGTVSKSSPLALAAGLLASESHPVDDYVVALRDAAKIAAKAERKQNGN